MVTPPQWIAFCNMIGLPELGPDPRYSATAERYLHAEELNGIIKPVLMHRTAMEWFEKGIELRLPYQSDPTVRARINAGQMEYIDIHLSHVAQHGRSRARSDYHVGTSLRPVPGGEIARRRLLSTGVPDAGR